LQIKTVFYTKTS